MIIKRNILLLEIFIAFSLLSLCLIPLTQLPHQSFLKQIKVLQELELARIEESLLLEMIMQNRFIDHKKLPTTREEALKQPRSFDSIEVSLDGFAKYRYDSSYILWQKQYKLGNDENEYRVLDCEIFFTPQKGGSFKTKKSFRHKIFTQKQGHHSH